MVKVGLVLSGGGTRGYAHIGVLKVLDKANIKVDAIAGCSIGAIIGAMYAYYESGKSIEHLVQSINLYQIGDLALKKKGLIKGKKIINKMHELLPAKRFNELKIPLFVNAVDARNGKERIFSKGDLLSAIRASMSFPGVFVPEKIGKREYLDGGNVNPLPFTILPRMDCYIMVDVSNFIYESSPKNIIDIIKFTVNCMQSTIVSEHLKQVKKPFVLIRPQLKKHPLFEMKYSQKVVDKGEIAAKTKISAIRKMIKSL